ncbi:5155_t:CDS:2 [Cetraspora pellucida]|uniref:5155_t:CDS:1 n=1 Tax=Cetraspora pellucida TaxID=1433469 RepID=A0A9N9BU53_9GLOM|nr:5155_t:CDS:2 [Cetraspora pellucida]
MWVSSRWVPTIDLARQWEHFFDSVTFGPHSGCFNVTHYSTLLHNTTSPTHEVLKAYSTQIDCASSTIDFALMMPI